MTDADGPIAGRSAPDVFMVGPVFLDLIFTGLNEAPTPGTELFAHGLGTAPGGAANIAVALSRLGLSVSLATFYGDDLYGEFLHRILCDQEEVDISLSRQLTDWSTPVTVSMAYGADRSMVTYSEPPPLQIASLVTEPPRTGSCFVHVDEPLPSWLRGLRAHGTRVFADLGWDATGVWSPSVLDRLADVDVFVPNSAEAMAYTRTTTPDAALESLAQRVPTVAVKCGSRGAIAKERSAPTIVEVPAVPVNAIDPTGAGDVFAAAFVVAHGHDWTLKQRLDFANLCAGLSVRHHSGSLGSPCWHDIAEWLAASGTEMMARFEYLRPLLPQVQVADRVRAMPTLRRISQADPGSDSPSTVVADRRSS